MFDVDEALKDYNKFMAFTRSLEGLRLITKEYLKGTTRQEYQCLLKNHHGAADFFYGSSHGYLTMYFCESKQGAVLIIHSIDDGFIAFFGPNESPEQAAKRIDLLINQINSWDGWIPNEEQCRQVEKLCGMWWNR